MERTGASIILGILLLLGSTPGFGDDGPAPHELGGVTITSRRPGPPPDRVISDFVDTHITKTRIDQLARWRDPICPHILGLTDDEAPLVSARIREVARAVEVPVAEDASCEPNIQVIFSAEPQQLLDFFAEHRSWMLGYHYISQRKELATVRWPVQAWYATATSAGGLAYLDDVNGTMPGGVPGRLSHGLSSEFAHVLVVADLGRIEGHDLGPLADYIALIALSQPQPADACSALPSILDLLARNCAGPKAQKLTAADMAFLQGLYGMNNKLVGSMETGQLFTLMRRSLRDQ